MQLYKYSQHFRAMRVTLDPQPIFPRSPGSSLEICYASPGAFSKDRPGGDGRTRESYNSSKDQIDDSFDGFREEDLRAGGPCLCPLPVEYPALRRSDPLCQRILSAFDNTRYRVRYILDRQGIDVHHISYNLNYACLADAKYAIPTINVAATRHSLEEPWLDTAREVYAFLASNGFPEFAVDILDPAALGQPCIFSALDTDLGGILWAYVKQLIAEKTSDEGVVKHEIKRWGYRPTREANPPTLVVTVRDEGQRDWRLYRERMVAILNSCGLFHIAVSIVRDYPGYPHTFAMKA